MALRGIPEAGGVRWIDDSELPPNMPALLDKASQALTANANYLALASPSNAQVAAQVATLTKECSAVIRLLLGQLDSTAGT